MLQVGFGQIKTIVAKWAESEPLVTKAYIFGSRAKGNYRDNSDLDVAVELEKQPGDSNVLATWICVGDSLEKRLSAMLPFKVQLENLDGAETLIVSSGVRSSSILIYDREATTNAT